MGAIEAHVEQLLGRRVRDVDGAIVGRLEEFRVRIVDGDPVVTEFHVGGAAILERIGAFGAQMPFFSWLPVNLYEYRIPWQDVDLSDPLHPRLRVRRSELRRVRRDKQE
jgi:sporulation protein YlmC with PRC-barrel domain